jgi:hypothetical protein
MYTVIVYQFDKRCKKGERKCFTCDYDTDNLSMLEHTLKHTWSAKKYRYEIHETFVTKKNLISGEEYQERFDTPNFCSPSSESYWSM